MKHTLFDPVMVLTTLWTRFGGATSKNVCARYTSRSLHVTRRHAPR